MLHRLFLGIYEELRNFIFILYYRTVEKRPFEVYAERIHITFDLY